MATETANEVPCEGCGKTLAMPVQVHTGAGEPLCESCWSEMYGPGGMFAPDDGEGEWVDATPDLLALLAPYVKVGEPVPYP